MKTTLLTFLIFTFCAVVPAQKKMTDREFEGFKGEVKSVTNEFLKLDDPGNNNTRKIESQVFFHKDGRYDHILYPSNNYKVVFQEIDGFKTFKSMEIKKEKNPPRVTGESKREPIEKPEKIVPPDERFDQKYVYEYDSQGRFITEREYLNNGKLSKLTKIKYDDQGRIIEENVNDTIAISKFVYKYDEKGNLVEELENRDIKGAGTDSTSRTVYSGYKLDAKGNWIERKREYLSETGETSWKTEYLEYRTIVYY